MGHRKNFKLKVPQPWSDRQDEAHRAIFCQKLNELLADHDVELWFGDETGIEEILAPGGVGSRS